MSLSGKGLGGHGVVYSRFSMVSMSHVVAKVMRSRLPQQGEHVPNTRRIPINTKFQLQFIFSRLRVLCEIRDT